MIRKSILHIMSDEFALNVSIRGVSKRGSPVVNKRSSCEYHITVLYVITSLFTSHACVCRTPLPPKICTDLSCD